MALGYAWFDSYDSVGYVVTLHISPHTDCPYLPIAKRAFFGTEGFFLPWADARRRKNRQFASLARSTARTDLGGRIERGLRDGGRRAGPSQGMSDMDGRALRASAITPDGRHPGRTAR